MSAPPKALKSISLDAVEVHGDAGDIAGEADAVAVGRDIDFLVDVRAVEEHRVVAALALDGVAAVARVPLERVAAGAHQGHVVAPEADDQVVAVAAEERVVAPAADERCRCPCRRPP